MTWCAFLTEAYYTACWHRNATVCPKEVNEVKYTEDFLVWNSGSTLRCSLTSCLKRSVLWAVDNGQLNIEPTHTEGNCPFKKSPSAQWPVNRDGNDGREHVSVYYHELRLHVSCDSRGRQIHSVFFFFFFLLRLSSPAIAYDEHWPAFSVECLLLQYCSGIQGQPHHLYE